jgi:light-regulated signal transduction histidine kinase (bacteriophytochrome)
MCALHCLNTVEHEIHQHLLQLHSICHYVREPFEEIGTEGNRVLFRFVLQHNDHFFNDFIYVNNIPLRSTFLEERTDTIGELSIKSQLGDDGQLLISVADTGVGLPAGKVDRLFDAFFTTKSQGTGLGLAITRSIVESHGGRIWATSNSGRGATFQFTLPSTLAAAA